MLYLFHRENTGAHATSNLGEQGLCSQCWGKGLIRTRLGGGIQSRSDSVEGATELFLSFVSTPNCACAQWLPGRMCVCGGGGLGTWFLCLRASPQGVGLQRASVVWCVLTKGLACYDALSLYVFFPILLLLFALIYSFLQSVPLPQLCDHKWAVSRSVSNEHKGCLHPWFWWCFF